MYTLSYIPQSVYVFVAHSRSTHSEIGATADASCFAKISHVNLTMGNNTQLLNTLNESDLYRISTANGLADYNRIKWGGGLLKDTPFVAETNGYVVDLLKSSGNILRLTPGIDITLPDRELVPGSQGEKIVFQISVDATDLHVTNTCPSPVTNVYTLYVVFQYGGIFTMVLGAGALDMIPIKSAQEALAAPIVRVPATPSAAFTQDVNGAGIWD